MKTEKNILSPLLGGVAGEYFVAAELSRRGYIASITLRNTRGVDILATNQDGSKRVTIQVKTNKNNKRDWLLNEKAETKTPDSHFYVFVNLKGKTERPEYHIVPSEVVADFTAKNHERWLKTPGRKGQAHNDSSMRKFIDLEGAYLDKWEVLGL